MAEDKAQAGVEQAVLPIRYYGNEDVPGLFADQVVISNLGGMFTLYFYQMQVPPFIGDANSPEFKQFQEGIKDVPARCVVRVVLTPALMEQFAKAITSNIEKYKRLSEHQSNEAEK